MGDEDEARLMQEEEQLEVTPIYRPMLEITNNGTTSAVLHGRVQAQSAAPELDSVIEDLLPSAVRFEDSRVWSRRL